MRNVIDEEHIACDYREPGTVHLARNGDEVRHMCEETALLNADGFAHQVLDRAQLQACVGATLSDEICGGSLLVGGGLVHSAKLVAGIARAAQRRGATLCQTQVTRVDARGNTLRIETDRGGIDTGGVVVAANAWTSELVPTMRHYITPVRGQVVSFEPIKPVFTHGFGTDLTDTGEHWQRTPDGTIVLGGCRAIHPTRDENTLSDSVSDEVSFVTVGGHNVHPFINHIAQLRYTFASSSPCKSLSISPGQRPT